MTKNSKTSIRIANRADYEALSDVMFEAVHHGSSPYTEAQRRAWVSQPRSGPEWESRLDGQVIFVAETDEQIVGFMSLAEQGYLDFAYIRPSFQGTGLFRSLYQEIESLAVDQSLKRIWVHASLAAESAFLAVGFESVRSEEVSLGDQKLRRFEMEKLLP